MAVFVLDRNKKPLVPCSEKRARIMLSRKRARIHRFRPFVIRLTDTSVANTHLCPLTIRIDPGSVGTGIALTKENYPEPQQPPRVHVVALFELQHRGHAIRDRLTSRKLFRKRRRTKLRYRANRYSNRARPNLGLPPSLSHRVGTTLTHVRRLQSWAPIGAIVQELAKFDLQRMQDPNSTGVQYKRGELEGQHIRAYLLEKWNWRCAYCLTSFGRLEIDHIKSRSSGGSNRLSNLVVACRGCNTKKGNRDLTDFLGGQPDTLTRIESQTRTSLADAAAVNTTRIVLHDLLVRTGVPVITSAGANTHWNRSRFRLPKTHAIDAACCGDMSEIQGALKLTVLLKCSGRGNYKRSLVDRFGFPRGFFARAKKVFGFSTGDLVRVKNDVQSTQKQPIGNIAVRSRGTFDFKNNTGHRRGVSWRRCVLLQRADGYTVSLASPLTQLDCEV